MTRPSLQWFRSKLVETRAGSLDSTKVPRILNGTGSRTRAYLVEKGHLFYFIFMKSLNVILLI